MEKIREQYVADIRYAIRLCQRTARLYRRLQTIGTFLAIIGGSAALTSLSGQLSTLIPVAGAVLFALVGAALIAIRPADKAAQNEADVRRYQSLMAKSTTMDLPTLDAAIQEAHQGVAQEIEPLRAIAYNDVVMELNRTDTLIPLSAAQKLLAMIA